MLDSYLSIPFSQRNVVTTFQSLSVPEALSKFAPIFITSLLNNKNELMVLYSKSLAYARLLPRSDDCSARITKEAPRTTFFRNS